MTKADEVRLFDVEQYTKPKHKHKRDWDGGVDPAWEDGSAFPPLWKVGARIRVKMTAELPQGKTYLNSNVGTVAAVNGFSTEVLFNESQNYEPHTVTLSNDCLELCPKPRDTSASLQESEDLSKELESPLLISPPSNSSNLTPTPKPSCLSITPTSPSTATSGTFPPELKSKIQSPIPPEPKSKIQSSIPPELKSKIQNPIPPELSKKRSASGWLEHYTKNKKLKDGTIATFPRVEGHREPEEPSHWYWAYKYEEKTPIAKSANGCITRAFSVPSSLVYSVRYAIASRWSISDILQLLKSC